MAVSAINKDVLFVQSSGKSVTINAGSNNSGNLEYWGITVPAGYKVGAVTPAVTGARSTNDSKLIVYGVGGAFDDIGVIVHNLYSTQLTWTVKLFVVLYK